MSNIYYSECSHTEQRPTIHVDRCGKELLDTALIAYLLDQIEAARELSPDGMVNIHLCRVPIPPQPIYTPLILLPVPTKEE